MLNRYDIPIYPKAFCYWQYFCTFRSHVISTSALHLPCFICSTPVLSSHHPFYFNLFYQRIAFLYFEFHSNTRYIRLSFSVSAIKGMNDEVLRRYLSRNRSKIHKQQNFSFQTRTYEYYCSYKIRKHVSILNV